MTKDKNKPRTPVGKTAGIMTGWSTIGLIFGFRELCTTLSSLDHLGYVTVIFICLVLFTALMKYP